MLTAAPVRRDWCRTPVAEGTTTMAARVQWLFKVFGAGACGASGTGSPWHGGPAPFVASTAALAQFQTPRIRRGRKLPLLLARAPTSGVRWKRRNLQCIPTFTRRRAR